MENGEETFASPTAAAADAQTGYRNRSAATTARAIAAAITGGVADLSPGRIPPWPDLRFLLGNFSSLVYCPFVRPRVRDSDSQSEDLKKSRVFRSTLTGMVRVKQLYANKPKSSEKQM